MINCRVWDVPSSAFIRGNRRAKRLRDVPRADGVANITSQIFWKKNEGETVPDNLSSKLKTYCSLSFNG